MKLLHNCCDSVMTDTIRNPKSALMKMPKILSTLLLLLLYVVSGAQVQWYQNQDGNNPPPNGTVGTSVQTLTSSSFIACYQWSITNDQATWKISKTNIAGEEQQRLLITGTTALVEMKAGHHNSVYVFERNFPLGQNAQYTIYKLDTNLVETARKTIAFPNSFNIFNLNAFEMDKADNVYFAGDGQYPVGPGFGPASFVLKTDKNLVTEWSRMDSVEASYTRLHIDHYGYITVINEFSDFFPDIKIKTISPDGQQSIDKTVATDPGRNNLFSVMDDYGNLFLYGDKSITDSTQAVFLNKISRYTGLAVYSRTLFTSISTQLVDMKPDGRGNLFTLVKQYFGPGRQLCKISRINTTTGMLRWSRSFPFYRDSSNFVKLVINENDQFYAIGEKRSHTWYSKGFMLRLRKNGHSDGVYTSPDSVAFLHSHWLSDGVTDRNNQLIAIGGTQDLDTTTFATTYLRAFAVRFGGGGNICNPGQAAKGITETTTELITQEEFSPGSKLVIYPNPVQNELSVSNPGTDNYDKLVVYNMQGAMLLQQPVRGTDTRVDVRSLTEGMYLLVVRSSALNKEKSTKFVIHR